MDAKQYGLFIVGLAVFAILISIIADKNQFVVFNLALPILFVAVFAYFVMGKK